MKIIYSIIALFLVSVFSMHGQVIINPQAGFNFTNLHNLGPNESGRVRVGWQAGADLRLGGRVYLQPGAFLSRSRTLLVIDDNTSSNTSDLIRTSAKLRGLVGLNIIQSKLFKLRVNAGPSYEFLLDKSVTDSYDGDELADDLENHFRDGVFYVDGGLGLDIWRLSGDVGYSFGLTNALNNYDVRYGIFFINVGIVIGSPD